MQLCLPWLYLKPAEPLYYNILSEFCNSVCDNILHGFCGVSNVGLFLQLLYGVWIHRSNLQSQFVAEISEILRLCHKVGFTPNIEQCSHLSVRVQIGFNQPLSHFPCSLLFCTRTER